MTKQFKGEVRLDVRDSTEDWSDDAYVALEQQFAAAMARD